MEAVGKSNKKKWRVQEGVETKETRRVVHLKEEAMKEGSRHSDTPSGGEERGVREPQKGTQQQVLRRQNAKWRQLIVEIVANQHFNQDVASAGLPWQEVWVLSLRPWDQTLGRELRLTDMSTLNRLEGHS